MQSEDRLPPRSANPWELRVADLTDALIRGGARTPYPVVFIANGVARPLGWIAINHELERVEVGYGEPEAEAERPDGTDGPAYTG